MATRIIPSLKKFARDRTDNLIFLNVYYGATYDYVKSAFTTARNVAGINEEEAYYVYGLNAPNLPDSNGFVEIAGGTVRIFSVAENQSTRELVDIFMQSMKAYENAKVIRVTTGMDALFAARSWNSPN